MKRVTIILAALLLASCGESAEAPSADEGVDQAATGAALIFQGGPIYTAVDTNPKVEAVVVDEGRIVYAGAVSGVDSYIGSRTQIVNLDGAALFPGFVDSHMHLQGVGERELTLNLEGTGSVAELVEAVGARVAEAAPGDIVFGRGWIETHWPEGRFPNRQDLDAISPDNPVILGRADGHATVANSMALAQAGITAETEPPFGGDILKDGDGEPTGMLIDRAQGLVRALIDAPTDEARANAFVVGGEVMTRYGWTQGQSMGVPLEHVGLVERLSDEGRLQLRVYVSINGANPEAVHQLTAEGARQSANGRIMTRAIKLYMDGALGSRGAALLEPYSDDETSGLLVTTHDDMLPLLIAALRGGIQVNSHAIGDRGNRLMLDWYEEAFNAVPAAERVVAEPRWRDEHTQIVHLDDLPRFAELGVIPSMQPSHAIGDLHFAPDRLGLGDRLLGAYAWRTLIDSGVVIAGGTDAPVERGDPLIEYYGAVARKDLSGFTGEGWHPEQAVSRQEALKMFTAWAAYASFSEDDLGTIEVGKIADLSIFSADLMTVAEAEIPKARALMTIIGGEIAYRAEDF